MNEFKKLVEILDTLLGPGGCPWDREQTFESLRTTILEEANELVDAINHGDRSKILEEAGDLLLNAIFVCKIGEKEEAFSTEQAIATLNEKLIRRHPHIFGEEKVENSEELITLWEKIKKEERKAAAYDSALDSIPKALPALAKASKVLKTMKSSGYPQPEGKESPRFSDEEALGRYLLDLVAASRKQGFDAEQALKKVLGEYEKEFRHWEQARSDAP